jgi:hypothetical protein
MVDRIRTVGGKSKSGQMANTCRLNKQPELTVRVHIFCICTQYIYSLCCTLLSKSTHMRCKVFARGCRWRHSSTSVIIQICGGTSHLRRGWWKPQKTEDLGAIAGTWFLDFLEEEVQCLLLWGIDFEEPVSSLYWLVSVTMPQQKGEEGVIYQSS